MRVKLFVSPTIKSASIDLLELDNTRATNGLKRSGCLVIGDIIDNWYKIEKFRGIGLETVNVIKNSVINYIISQLTDDELIDWFDYLISNNSAESLRPILEGLG